MLIFVFLHLEIIILISIFDYVLWFLFWMSVASNWVQMSLVRLEHSVLDISGLDLSGLDQGEWSLADLSLVDLIKGSGA